MDAISVKIIAISTFSISCSHTNQHCLMVIWYHIVFEGLYSLMMVAWSTLNTFSAVDYGKSLDWIHKGPISDYSLYHGVVCQSPSLLPPPPSVLLLLIACFIKVNWNARTAVHHGFVMLQYHWKLNTQFSFKPKWHLTHPSNKSKQFKHRGDGGGRGICTDPSPPLEITRSFKWLVLQRMYGMQWMTVAHYQRGTRGMFSVCKLYSRRTFNGERLRQPAPSALIEVETNGRLSLGHTSGD